MKMTAIERRRVERVFGKRDEFVDLIKLEAHVLHTFTAKRAHGAEWFYGSIEDAARHIDRVMCEHSLTYDF